MMDKPLIMVNTENYPKFCDNRCNNISCKKHFVFINAPAALQAMGAKGFYTAIKQLAKKK